MRLTGLWGFRWLGVPYTPHPETRTFLDRAVVQRDNDVEVTVAVLDDRESDHYFGVPLARRGIQPVWLKINNQGHHFYRLRVASIDANYYPPLEAAYVNHFRIGRRILEFGILAWLFLPLLLIMPFKLLGARAANRKMNAFFVDQGIGWGLIQPGKQLEGFVFSTLNEGSKQFTVKLIGPSGNMELSFSIPIPGLRVDHHGKELDEISNPGETVEVDEAELLRQLEKMPRCTTNRLGTREGDPLNLVVIGDFQHILNGFGASWDETEVISIRSCWRTLTAFSLGRRYRYSPVSSLFHGGRSQDFALQKARQTINERLHLRLWITNLRCQNKSVWIGQISRDIGVRFTYMTWNLTTHKIDPDVDDARDCVLDYLMESGKVVRLGYVPGAGLAAKSAPRHNLTGDPYFTDGQRAVAFVSETKTSPTFLSLRNS